MPGLNDPFAEFYSGPMLAPNRVGGKLVQAPIYSGPTSISDMYKGIYADVPQKPSAFNPVGPGPDWGALTGMTADPIYSAPATRTAETQVPGLPANGAGYGAGTTKGASVRLMPSLSYADAFGQVYGAQPRSGSSALGAIDKETQNLASMFSAPGSAFMVNGWGHQAYPMGDPGTPTNVHADNGLFGVPATGFATQGNAPAPSSGGDGGSSIGAMFGDPVTLASGTHSTVGATGTAQDGRYSYVVQPGGAIAKTINPTPVATNDSSYFAGSRQQAQQNTLKALGFHGDGY